MAFIPAENIVKVVVEYLLDGQNLANIFHVAAGGSPSEAVINAILDIFEDWVNDHLSLFLSEDIQITGITGKDLTTEDGANVERPLSPTVQGANESPALPNNVALCLTSLTGLGGRSFRGRTYLPGLSENDVTLSEISLLAATEFAGMLITLVNDLVDADFDLVVTSFQHNNAPRVAAVSTPISAVACNVVLDSQRRRLPGRGD